MTGSESPAVRRCTKCGAEKPLTGFQRRSDRPDSYASWCKACKSEARRGYRESDPEAELERARLYREENPDAVLASMRRYREGHRETLRERARLRYESDPETARQRARLYREENHESMREHRRQQIADIRMKVLTHYSPGSPPCCACCGITERLTIDHVGGGGNKHRKEVLGPGKRSTAFYRWLIEQGFPAGYQILCVPCNASKGTSTHCRLNHGQENPT